MDPFLFHGEYGRAALADGASAALTGLDKTRIRLLAGGGVLRRALLRLPGTIFAADGHFPIARLYLDACAFDLFVADGTGSFVHGNLPRENVPGRELSRPNDLRGG